MPRGARPRVSPRRRLLLTEWSASEQTSPASGKIHKSVPVTINFIKKQSNSNNGVTTDGQQFTTVMAFTDPYVGAWTIRAADGAATVSEGEAADPDLVVTQSAVAFEKSTRRMQNPIQAILSGELHFSNFESLVNFRKLFQTMTTGAPNPIARA